MVIQKNDPFYSDLIIRINSREIRKVRILVITNDQLYIIIEEAKSEFKIKCQSKLSQISRVEAASNNALLINIAFKDA